jgi:hypothetical protein
LPIVDLISLLSLYYGGNKVKWFIQTDDTTRFLFDY